MLTTRIPLLSPDFVVQELPRTNGAEDAAPEAATRAVQVQAVWVVRHQSNIPQKKQAQGILGRHV